MRNSNLKVKDEDKAGKQTEKEDCTKGISNHGLSN